MKKKINRFGAFSLENKSRSDRTKQNVHISVLTHHQRGWKSLRPSVHLPRSMEVILNVLNSQNKYQFDWSLSGLVFNSFRLVSGLLFFLSSGKRHRWFMDVTSRHWRRHRLDYSCFRSLTALKSSNALLDRGVIEILPLFVAIRKEVLREFLRSRSTQRFYCEELYILINDFDTANVF